MKSLGFYLHLPSNGFSKQRRAYSLIPDIVATALLLNFRMLCFDGGVIVR